MPRRNWMYYLAVGLAFTILPALGQEARSPQDRPPQDQHTSDSDQGQTAEAVAEKPTVEAPPVSPSVAPSGSGNENHDNGAQPKKNSEPEKSLWQTYVSWKDTLAQWFMAISGFAAIIISLVAVVLVKLTLDATRAAVVEAERTTAEARRQADAMIQLEAAKLAVSKILLLPPGGGVIQENGVPRNGLTAKARIKNIGKTRAFILKTCICFEISDVMPKKEFPADMHRQIAVNPGVDSGKFFLVEDGRLTVSLTEEEREMIDNEETFLWAMGCVWFKDWFDIKREFEFMWRWKVVPLPHEHVSTKTGFIPYEPAT